MIQYPFSPYALVAVIALLFTLPATAYLLWLRPKSTATLYLLGFLGCIIASLGCMYVFHAAFFWVWPLWPLQDAFLILGGWCIVRFAYSFPEVDNSREARLVSLFFIALNVLGFGAIGLATRQFLLDDTQLHIPGDFWNLMPVTVVLAVVVFLRRMVVFARPAHSGRSWGWTQRLRHFWRTVRRPPNANALAHRNFAFATLSGLVQGLASVVPTSAAGTFLWILPAETFIALGTLLTIALFVLAYLNATAHRSTLLIRIVGASLVIVLTIVGSLGIQVLKTASVSYFDTRLELNAGLLQQLQAAQSIVPPASLEYIARIPDLSGAAPGQIELLYINANLSPAVIDRIRAQIASTPVAANAYVFNGKPVVDIERMLPSAPGTRQKLIGYQYPLADQTIELGYVDSNRNLTSHQLVTRIVTQSTVGTVALLAILLAFFDRSLRHPLNRLVHGVGQVEAGDLQTRVPITVDDEIGYLTRSFNAMTGSLYDLTTGLEQQVQTRTAQLRQRTLELENEIAQRKRVQSELAVAKESAEAASRAKSIFLSNMSHELRTPLNTVFGYMQLLQRDPLAGGSDSAVLERSRQHLVTLIDDMLDLARIEAGKVQLEMRPTLLVGFLNEVVIMAASSLRNEAVSLRLETTLSPSLSLAFDQTRLRQVLLNLLGNAVKFTDAGSITLHAVAVAQQPQRDTVHVRFSVRDTGIGIVADQLALIFEPLHQTERGRARSDGRGLGLAISRDLIALMGGALTVESEVGVGSSFAFTLALPLMAQPATAAAPAPRADATLATGCAPHIIVVDDNDDNRAMLGQLLTRVGFSVSEYADARHALAAAQTDPPAAILTDLLMPEFDGIALITALRAARVSAGVPIVAMSASAFQEDAAACIAAGADEFLAKPLDLNALLGVLDRLLPLQWEAAPARPALPQQWPAAETIARLRQLALEGAVSELAALSSQLAQEPQLADFAAQLQRYVSSIQLRQLTEWLTPDTA